MDYFVAFLTLLSMELIGRKHWLGWGVGLINQGFWAYLVVYQQQLWGLGILTVALTYRYSAHLIRWRREGA